MVAYSSYVVYVDESGDQGLAHNESRVSCSRPGFRHLLEGLPRKNNHDTDTRVRLHARILSTISFSCTSMKSADAVSCRFPAELVEACRVHGRSEVDH